MKKLLLFIMILLMADLSMAQWGPDVRLTNDTANSATTGAQSRSLATNGDTVHVVWCDHRDGNDETYYKRSTDGGLSWGADTRLTNDPAMSNIPSIAVSDSLVIVFWSDNRDGNPEIYCKRSQDGGESWGTDTRLTNAAQNSYGACVAISGPVVHVVWHDWAPYNWEIYYKRSTDGGSTWEPSKRMTFDPANSFNPSIAVSDSVVHVSWDDARSGNRRIYYKRSTDGGLNWGNDTELTHEPPESKAACITSSGTNIHLVWYDMRDLNYEIYYKRSADGGITWGADTRLTNNGWDSKSPNITVSGSVVHVVWIDNRDSDLEVYYKRSEDNGANWGSDTRLTNAPGDCKFSFVEVSGPVVHVLWSDLRDGNWEIYYKRDPTGGFPVGIDNESADNTGQPITIYPNPTCTILNISFISSSDENITLRVWNMSGQILKVYNFISVKGINQYTITLDDFRDGLYFMGLTTGSQNYYRKIIIRK